MNVYSKFCPNVFLAKCEEKYEKGEVIEVTTKYGKENECIVFNLIYEKDGFYYYSIVRADGFNVQEWAKQRAERHRKMIDDAWNNMGKSVEFSDKAVEHERVAEYWEKKAEVINLSMPESIDYYEHKLEKAKEYHEGLKPGKYPREHSYSLTYAKKAVNEMQKNYDTAKRLWGEQEN